MANGMATPSMMGNFAENPFYKTKLCNLWIQHGNCVRGTRCLYAHGPTELRARPQMAALMQMQMRPFFMPGQVPGARPMFPGMFGLRPMMPGLPGLPGLPPGIPAAFKGLMAPPPVAVPQAPKVVYTV